MTQVCTIQTLCGNLCYDLTVWDSNIGATDELHVAIVIPSRDVKTVSYTMRC